MEPLNNVIKSKKNSIALGIVGLLVIATLGYYFWLNSGRSSSNPPSLHVPKKTTQGLITGDVICQIPGLYSFTDDYVNNYTKPAGTTDADANKLSAGIHIYHANSELKVSEILKNIVPTQDNKIMIAYYPSNANSESNFSVYPTDLQGEKKILTPDNYKIPANEGFVIFSCQDSKIYKIFDEKSDGTALPTNFSKSDSKTHWVLFSGWKNGTKTLKDTLATYDVKSLWVQNGDGFSFTQVDVNSATISGNYRMVWAEIAANPIKPQIDPQKAICEANPACTTHTCISFWGGYTCNMSTSGTGTSGATGVDVCNTTGGAFNSSGCSAKSGVPYPSSGVVSGKADYCNTTGGSYNYSGCLSQKSASGTTLGISELCNSTGANFNSTGCFISGGTPIPPVKNAISAPLGTGLQDYFMVSYCSTQCNYSNYTCKQPSNSENWYCLKNGTSFPASMTIPVASPELKITGTKIGSLTAINGKAYVEVSFDFSLTGTLTPFDQVVWDFGDGSVGGLQGIKGKDWFYGNDILATNKTSHNYTKSGNYTVTVKALSPTGKVLSTASTYLPFPMPSVEIIPKSFEVNSCDDPSCPSSQFSCAKPLAGGETFVCKEKIAYQCLTSYSCSGMYICPANYQCSGVETCTGNITKKDGSYICTKGYSCTGKLSCDSSTGVLNMACGDIGTKACSGS